jgi:hypothetical protein
LRSAGAQQDMALAMPAQLTWVHVSRVEDAALRGHDVCTRAHIVAHHVVAQLTDAVQQHDIHIVLGAIGDTCDQVMIYTSIKLQP